MYILCIYHVYRRRHRPEGGARRGAAGARAGRPAAGAAGAPARSSEPKDSFNRRRPTKHPPASRRPTKDIGPFICGSDYKFTNYKVKNKSLTRFQQDCQRGDIQVVF